MTVDLGQLLAPAEAAVTETDFHAAWLADAAGYRSPFAMAVRGGALAAGFAGVFSAGYQAALRVTFPQVAFRGWGAFVVSEATGEQALPGLVWSRTADGYLLNGYKTWVAACDVVEQLVVRAADAHGQEALFVLVERAADGLTVTRKAAPRVLPALSQGTARFDNVNVKAAALLDATRVRYFGIVEPFYIYLAFLSMSHQRLANATLRETIHGVLQEVADLDPVAASGRQLADFDTAVQNLRRGLVNLVDDDLQWRADAKLIAMYSKAMQGRL